MNDKHSIAISALGLLPLAIFLVVISNTLLQSVCDRFLSEEDPLDDPISLARVAGLKYEVWRRIDQLDTGHSLGFLDHSLDFDGLRPSMSAPRSVPTIRRHV